MTAGDPTSRPGPPVPGWRALALPLAVGALLRVWGLGHQVIGGDELFPFRAAVRESLTEIVTTFRAPDHYLPMAAVARLVLVSGGVLDERWLRLPSVAAGLLAILLVPRFASPRIGRRAAIVAAWLLALHPTLVAYGRIVRAYAPLVLLATLGALALRDWLERRATRSAAGYVGCATLSLLTHPVTLPTAVGPWAYALLRASARRFDHSAPSSPESSSPSWRQLLGLGGALAAGLALVLVPRAESLRALAATRRIDPLWSGESVFGLLAGFAGTARPGAIAAGCALAAWGLVVTSRRDRASAELWSLLAVGQVVGVAVLAPVGVHEPLLLVRYALTALPFLLLAAAVGITDLSERVAARFGPARGPLAMFAVAGGLLAAWTLGGPLVDPVRWRSSFVQHNDFVTFGCPRPTLAPASLPAAYATIAARSSPSDLVVELPWSTQWRFGRVWPLYEEAHRRPVVMATADRLVSHPRVRLRSVIPSTVAAIRARKARFVVLHRQPTEEERALRDAPCGVPSPAQHRDPHRAVLAGQARALEAELQAGFGPPTQSDSAVWLWDLEAPAPGPESAGTDPPAR